MYIIFTEQIAQRPRPHCFPLSYKHLCRLTPVEANSRASGGSGASVAIVGFPDGFFHLMLVTVELAEVNLHPDGTVRRRRVNIAYHAHVQHDGLTQVQLVLNPQMTTVVKPYLNRHPLTAVNNEAVFGYNERRYAVIRFADFTEKFHAGKHQTKRHERVKDNYHITFPFAEEETQVPRQVSKHTANNQHRCKQEIKNHPYHHFASPIEILMQNIHNKMGLTDCLTNISKKHETHNTLIHFSSSTARFMGKKGGKSCKARVFGLTLQSNRLIGTKHSNNDRQTSANN